MTVLQTNPGSTVPGFRMIDGQDIDRLAKRVNEFQVSVNLTASGAIPIKNSSANANTTTVSNAFFAITATSAAALTLAAPFTDDQFLVIYSATNFAHTITATGLLATGSANQNVATFAAFAGASLQLVSKSGKWIVLTGANAITFS